MKSYEFCKASLIASYSGALAWRWKIGIENGGCIEPAGEEGCLPNNQES